MCGTEKLVEKARSPKVIASNEMSESQAQIFNEIKLTSDNEAVIWYYDQTMIGSGKEGNVLTTKRVASFKNGKVFDATFDKITDVEHELGDTSERIRIELKSGEFVVLKFGVLADSKSLYESLCKKAEGACSKGKKAKNEKKKEKKAEEKAP